MNLKNKMARKAVERKLKQRPRAQETSQDEPETATPPTSDDLNHQIAEIKLKELEGANAKLKERLRCVRGAIEG